ncbi:hypothetical protein Dsin_011508 [Dipteronia sinensis]|uniref:DUF1985 domain-containing protein n=1 Tax=Dipteronia sinensis TaxID=43782 RepID=A0AAE0EDK7_9ROSI|nr:hypothetical protein Dsin_011508 [Dipteronia sinensis]
MELLQGGQARHTSHTWRAVFQQLVAIGNDVDEGLRGVERQQEKPSSSEVYIKRRSPSEISACTIRFSLSLSPQTLTALSFDLLCSLRVCSFLRWSGPPTFIRKKNGPNGKEEFLLITGLRFGPLPDVDVLQYKPSPDSVYSRLFKGKATHTKDILMVLNRGGDINKDDMMKMGYVFFLSHSLLGRDARLPVPKWLWGMVEDLSVFEAFPWGTFIFSCTIYWLRRALVGRVHGEKDKTDKAGGKKDKTGGEDIKYNIYGFSWALMYWAMEAIPILTGIQGVVPPSDDDKSVLRGTWSSVTHTDGSKCAPKQASIPQRRKSLTISLNDLRSGMRDLKLEVQTLSHNMWKERRKEVGNEKRPSRRTPASAVDIRSKRPLCRCGTRRLWDEKPEERTEVGKEKRPSQGTPVLVDDTRSKVGAVNKWTNVYPITSIYANKSNKNTTINDSTISIKSSRETSENLSDSYAEALLPSQDHPSSDDYPNQAELPHTRSSGSKLSS